MTDVDFNEPANRDYREFYPVDRTGKVIGPPLTDFGWIWDEDKIPVSLLPEKGIGVVVPAHVQRQLATPKPDLSVPGHAGKLARFDADGGTEGGK